MNPGPDATWLVLETSGRTGSVALARGERIVREASLDSARRHVRDLAAMVQTLLDAESLRPAEIAGVMVSIGPGSYTALRVGVMSAKAFAYATGCALIAVPTFAALAEQAPADATSVVVLADALQGLAYVQGFRRENGTMTADDELRIVPVAECPGGEVLFTGPGASLLPAGLPLAPEADRHPRVESLLRVGLRMAPVTREELFALEPLYLRGSSAEEKAKRDAI